MDGEVEGCVVSVTKYIIVNSCHNSNKKLADEDTALDPKCEMEKIEWNKILVHSLNNKRAMRNGHLERELRLWSRINKNEMSFKTLGVNDLMKSDLIRWHDNFH